MSNITIACIALAVFSASSVIGGVVLIVWEVLEGDKKGQKGQKGQKGTKPPVWFHSMDIREEVEKMEENK